MGSKRFSDEGDARALAVGTPRISANEVLAHLGYGCFIGWYFVAAFGLLPQVPADAAGGFAYPICLISFFCGMLFLTCMSAFVPITFLARHERAIMPLSAIGSLLLPAYVLLSFAFSGPDLVVMVVLSFLSGAVASASYYLWDSLCLRLHVPSHLRLLCVSLVIGSCLYLLVQLLVVREGQGLACIVLALASSLLVGFLRHGSQLPDDAFMPSPEATAASRIRFGTKNRPRIARLNQRVRVLFFLFGIAFGIAWIMLVMREPLTLYPVFVFIVVGMVALGAVFHRDPVIHDRHVSMLMRICIMVIAVCFLIVLVAPYGIGTLFLGAVCSFWQVFWVVDTALLLRHTQKHAFSILKHTATGKLSSTAGLLLGELCATALIMLLGYDQALMGLFCAVIIVCVVSSMTLLPFSKTTMLGQGQASEDPEDGTVAPNHRGQSSGWEGTCSLLVDAYGLSPREGEILVCIACGHNNRAISEELVVSEHTVKSHVYNIYQKLGVHSRQEVFEILERFSSEHT